MGRTGPAFAILCPYLLSTFHQHLPTRLLCDDALLAQCRWDQYRGSGPGGQKRNKTSNAVRLTHEPTGVAVTATESRSLSVNKLYALRRLRLKLAADLREPVDL